MSRWDLRRPSSAEIALGFAGWKPGVGGVRNHMEAIRRQSRHSVRLLPGNFSSRAIDRDAYLAEFRSRVEAGSLESFRLIHSHVDPRFTTAALRAQAKGSKWVHTYHSYYFENAWGPLEKWQEEINDSLTQVACHADVRIAVSPSLQKFLSEAHGIESILIPNGVDIALCDDARGDRFSEQSGFKDFVVFVGSLTEVKNPRLFLDMAGAIPARQFVMIGKNLLPDSLEKSYGKRLPPNVAAVGPLTHRETVDAIAASSAMVMTSNFEGLPTALMEAMALGKPVAATDVAGCRDAIGDETCGVLFEVQNLDQCIAAATEALARPEIGENAAKRARAMFDWKVMIARIDEIYDRLLPS